MDISSTSHASSGNRAATKRQIVSSTSSSHDDRAADNKAEAALADNKSQDRAQARAQQEHEYEKNQQAQRDEQRRLDGRLVSYGQKNGDEATDYKQLELKRERVNEAYSPPEKSESHRSEQLRQSHDNEAIDLVV